VKKSTPTEIRNAIAAAINAPRADASADDPTNM